MAKIDFLSVIIDQGVLPEMNQLLERFKQKSGHTIQGSFVGWDTLWRETTNVGIYKKGADIAETGSTWLEGLVAMHCLHPFTPQEIARLGGKEAFLAPSWSAVTIGNSEQVWGIPVRADVRVLWYWEDMLEQVKLDPQTAFSSFERFPETFEALKAVVATPWAPAVDNNSLQSIASWIWDAGGDFISKDGKKVLFTEPAARKGISAYFGLYPYMPKSHTHISAEETQQIFAERKTCATITGPWLQRNLDALNIPTDRLKAIPIPGPAFVGGSVMAIYEHTRVTEAVINFLEFVTHPENQLQYARLVGLLPTRHKAWDSRLLSSDPLYQVLYKAFSHGRTYPSVPLWGVLEQKLYNAMVNSWYALLSKEQPNIDTVIDENFVPMARRLEISLNN